MWSIRVKPIFFQERRQRRVGDKTDLYLKIVQDRRHVGVHDRVPHFVHEFLLGLFTASFGPEKGGDLLQLLQDPRLVEIETVTTGIQDVGKLKT